VLPSVATTCAHAVRPHMAGRVEHAMSGQVAHFRSPEALLTFLARVLRKVQEDHPEEDLYGLC
jgi:hypothetical protein